MLDLRLVFHRPSSSKKLKSEHVVRLYSDVTAMGLAIPTYLATAQAIDVTHNQRETRQIVCLTHVLYVSGNTFPPFQ